MNNIVFGQYYPSGSVVHRLDPRVKLVMVLLYIVTVFFVVDYAMYGALFLFVLAVALLSKVPLRILFRTVRTIVILVLITAVINLFFTQGEEMLFSWKFIHIYKPPPVCNQHDNPQRQ